MKLMKIIHKLESSKYEHNNGKTGKWIYRRSYIQIRTINHFQRKLPINEKLSF